MTVVAEQPRRAAPTRRAGNFLLSDVSWDGYLKLLDEVGDRAVRMTYDNGLLEFEVPSELHELIADLVGDLVKAALDEADVDHQSYRSTTWRRAVGRKGLEADACFYVASLPALPDRAKIDLDRDPPPDLAIEAEVTSALVDKVAVYAGLGVPELWRVSEEGGVRFFRLSPAGTYEQVDRSVVVPGLDAATVTRFVQMLDPLGKLSGHRVVREFRAWLASRV